MSGDMMPKQQYDFIKGIQDNMLEASNMTEGDAWRFGFLIWQHQEWICKYLIDRKTEPIDKDINVRSKDKPNCEECKHFHENAVMYLDQCDFCFKDCKYEPKDEPQTDMAEDIVRSYGFKAESYQQAKARDEPQPMTDAEITEFAKEIVHKMIDNSVIAEDAYPDLRQRMHEAVERLDEYYPSEDERNE